MSDTIEDYLSRPLLAKSVPKRYHDKPASKWPEAVFLEGHLRDVREVAEVVAEVVGASALESLGLDPATWLERLEKTLVLAAGLHDLGKANSRFQEMVRPGGDRDLAHQPVRHEAISAYMALHPGLFGAQLFPEGELSARPLAACAVLAVLGHHVKFCARGASLHPGVSDASAGGDVLLLMQHEGFQRAARAIGLSCEDLDDALFVSSREELLEAPGEGLDDRADDLFDFLLEEVCGDEPPPYASDKSGPMSALQTEWGRFIALVKALLVSCDVIGSAVPREVKERTPAEWARDVLGAICSVEDLTHLIDLKYQQFGENAAGAGEGGPDAADNTARQQFQSAIAEEGRSHRVVVAVAGCGSGKTLAAYIWARENAADRKLFFCYPTTGTTTSGFEDYAMSVDFYAELVHGRAAVDIERLYSNSDVEDDESAREEGASMRGLEMLSAKLVVCTVDSVLGLMQNHRRGLTSAAAIASGAFVFDEIHSYDESMWQTLLHFLQLFPRVPVLLMSASLPASRREELEDLLGEEVSIPPGPERLETRARYTITRTKQPAALKKAAEAAAEGKKVLVVANTVRRCLEYREEVSKALEGEGVKLLVYHSRFRYEDRVARHQDVVETFKAGSGATGAGAVAFTTQVAEMSLDLDADLLVTDLAPASSLIQRMGRLNRKATEHTPARECVVIELDHTSNKERLPYDEQQLLDALTWLDELPGYKLSQRDLAEAFERVEEQREAEVSADLPSTLVSEPVYASKGSLREAGVTGSFLLSRDANRISGARSRARKLSGDDAAREWARASKIAIQSALPMVAPRWFEYWKWRREGAAYVIPEGLASYDEEVGATWVNTRRRVGGA